MKRNYKLDLKQCPGTWNNGTFGKITYFNIQCCVWNMQEHNISMLSVLYFPMFHCSMCQTIVSIQV